MAGVALDWSYVYNTALLPCFWGPLPSRVWPHFIKILSKEWRYLWGQEWNRCSNKCSFALSENVKRYLNHYQVRIWDYTFNYYQSAPQSFVVPNVPQEYSRQSFSCGWFATFFIYLFSSDPGFHFENLTSLCLYPITSNILRFECCFGGGLRPFFGFPTCISTFPSLSRISKSHR